MTHHINRGRRLRRPTVALIASIVALTCVHAAHASPDPALSTIASRFRGTPITVDCAQDQQTWNAQTAAVGLPNTVNGYTYPGQSVSYYAPWVCQTLYADQPTVAMAYYSLTFFHELIHTVGVVDEGQADCGGLEMMRYGLRKWFGMTPGQAQEMYQAAWQYHIAKPAQYRGICTYEPFDGVSYLNL